MRLAREVAERGPIRVLFHEQPQQRFTARQRERAGAEAFANLQTRVENSREPEIRIAALVARELRADAATLAPQLMARRTTLREQRLPLDSIATPDPTTQHGLDAHRLRHFLRATQPRTQIRPVFPHRRRDHRIGISLQLLHDVVRKFPGPDAPRRDFRQQQFYPFAPARQQPQRRVALARPSGQPRFISPTTQPTTGSAH